jgi:hypothetical protein
MMPLVTSIIAARKWMAQNRPILISAIFFGVAVFSWTDQVYSRLQILTIEAQRLETSQQAVIEVNRTLDDRIRVLEAKAGFRPPT